MNFSFVYQNNCTPAYCKITAFINHLFGSNIEKPTRCNNNNLLTSKISSTCFGQSFVHLQERKTEIFRAYGIVSCKDGYTNSYVVLMRYVVLINVTMIGVCVVLCLGRCFIGVCILMYVVK